MSTPDSPQTPPHTRSRRRRRMVVATVAAVVAIAVGATTLLPAASTEPTGHDVAASHSAASGPAERRSSIAYLDSWARDVRTIADDASRSGPETTTTTVAAEQFAAPDVVVQTGAAPSSVPNGQPAHVVIAGPPVIHVEPSVTLDPAVYETDLVIENLGQSPLQWQAALAPGDSLSPDQGTIAPGGHTVAHYTADEYASGTKAWMHQVTFSTNAGQAVTEIHGTTMLPAVLEMVGGNHLAEGNGLYLMAVGEGVAHFQFKNDGDLPANITYSLGAHGRFLFPAEETIGGGFTTNFMFAACGIPVSGLFQVVDVLLEVELEGQAPVPLLVRFRIPAGHDVGPC